MESSEETPPLEKHQIRFSSPLLLIGTQESAAAWNFHPSWIFKSVMGFANQPALLMELWIRANCTPWNTSSAVVFMFRGHQQELRNSLGQNCNCHLSSQALCYTEKISETHKLVAIALHFCQPKDRLLPAHRSKTWVCCYFWVPPGVSSTTVQSFTGYSRPSACPVHTTLAKAPSPSMAGEVCWYSAINRRWGLLWSTFYIISTNRVQQSHAIVREVVYDLIMSCLRWCCHLRG